MKRTLIAAVLSLALVFAFGAGSSVFAADGDAAPNNGPFMVKYLKLADGVTNPNVTFTFQFKSSDQGAPTIADQTITPNAKSESTKDGASVVGQIDLKTVVTRDLFDHAGVYHYTVSEKAEAAGFTDGEKQTKDGDTTIKEKITFSSEKYTMEVRVANDGNGGVKDPEIVVVKSDDPTDKNKIDATDSDPTVTEEPKEGGGTEEVDHGEEATIPGFSFTNVYSKSTAKPVNPNPEDPTQGQYGAAGITKVVSGQYGDKTFAFPFTLTMTAGTGVTETEATAYIYTGKTKGDAVTVTFGTPQKFNLKDGQSLIFEELPAGVSYDVAEALQGCKVENESKYIASFNGTPSDAGTNASGSITVSDAANAENDAHFINALDDRAVTPTGILINNLPYILLILIAIAGIAVFTRKRRYQ